MERNSSIEVYRILATFAVLVFHFNGWLVGGMPKHFDMDNVSLFRIVQALIEACTCICVNMFIIISGYFGIRLKFQSVLRICLLLFSIHVPFYIIDCLFFDNTFQLKVFVKTFLVISNGGYFIQCYMMLMFLSPIINSFVENNKVGGLYYCVLFLFVEFWFDCITHTDNIGFNHGYSVIHFVLIYMLARYLSLNKERFLEYKKQMWIFGYLLCSLIIFEMYLLDINYVWQYSNPIIIFSAFCSFIPFLYNSYLNENINWVAKSTLAVYIIHVTVPVYYIVKGLDNYCLLYYSYPSYLLCMICCSLAVFVISIFYDKVRLLVTNPLERVLLLFFNNVMSHCKMVK